jgi:hypothetical protein
MADVVESLLRKALSTASEEEAIAALRMARKKSDGSTVDVGDLSTSLEKARPAAKHNHNLGVQWMNHAKQLHAENRSLRQSLKDAKRGLDLARATIQEYDKYEQDKAKADTSARNMTWFAFGVVIVLLIIIALL